jgi:hypothetical protein
MGKRKEKGQISVMVGMMTLTFMLFFAFVVNTGMLVNAKINLQNAADLAAYAGAAVQARQLTQISFLNYEMRRQLKKFLFRYYVMGNLAQKTHPGSGGATSGKRMWSPDGSFDFKVPSVCIIFNARDNYCQLAELRPISIPPSTPLDAINTTLRGQLTAIEEIRTRNCIGIGETNKNVLSYWLFNTDPTLANIEAQFQGASQELAGMLAVIKGLAFGLGIIPKQMLLRQRIETLNYYLNFPVQKEVTLEKANGLRGQGDVAARERTIQAFFSAYNTLGNHTFDDVDSIRMDELMPSSSEGAQMLILKDVKISFDTYAVDFLTGTVPPNPDAAQACVAYQFPMVVGGSVPVAVYKDPNILTYYAIRLMAKAKVMFNPFGPDLQLKAYAAAQPFGSRIGPIVTPDDFTTGGSAGKEEGLCMAAGCVGKILNLPIGKNDSPAGGWNMQEVIFAMGQKFEPENAGAAVTQQKITVEGMERAYQAAMVPNPWEEGRYNIINDLTDDPFVKYFPTDQKTHFFWAPLVSLDKIAGGATSELRQKISTMVNEITATPQAASNAGATAAPNLINNNSFKTAFVDALQRYINAMKTGAGENGEGFNVVSLVDPFFTRPEGGAAPQLINLNPQIMTREPGKIKTSYSAVRDSNLAQHGRTGYSVKFVSFKTLLTRNTTTNGQATWINPPDGGSEGAEDLPVLQH